MLPPIVRVPLRLDPDVFGPTVNVAGDEPDPALPGVIHHVLEDGDHEQPSFTLTFTVPGPPEALKDCVLALSV